MRIKRFVLFHDKRHPAEMGEEEIRRFLTALAVQREVSASTQNQALAALLFLYREVLGRDPGWIDDVARAKRPQRLPVVLSRSEVARLLATLDGTVWIGAMLLYGGGLRVIEMLRLDRLTIHRYPRPALNPAIPPRPGGGHDNRQSG